MFGHDSHVTELLLAHDLQAPAAARRFVVDQSVDLPPELVADAVLLVSELVTNAVLHGRPQLAVHVRSTPPVMEVAVSDGGHGFIAPTTPSLPGDAHGRGLLLVDAIARTYGVLSSPKPPGTTVWFDLSAHDYI